MKKLYYPAKFKKSGKFYLVQYIDFENIYTQGKGLQNVYFMAQDAML